MRVMDERFGRHGVVAGMTDAIARDAERLLAAGERPAEPFSSRRIRIEEQALGLRLRDRPARIGRGGGGDFGQGPRDIGRPRHAFHRRRLSQRARDTTPHVEDALALPSGSQHDGDTAQPAGK